MKKKVTIIDYGAGNVLSVFRAFDACSANTEVTSNIKKIKDSSYLVLPGDGSFKFASDSLKKKGMFEILKNHYIKGNPLMGICLGMQMLMSKGEEFGHSLGLSIIKGKVIKIKKQNKIHLKIPVIGWHPIKTQVSNNRHKLIKTNKYKDKKFYFVHSYRAMPDIKKDILEHLWKVIISDNTVDQYESNLMRRICGLIYFSDKECAGINLKLINS